MNFLGHIYFSNNNIELMYANLYGDHVKGSDYSRFPEIVQNGIRLHRSIDNYIDHHPVVIELMHKLYPELPKVTGIAIDLFFDHLLAIHWKEYHSEGYFSFLNRFYTYTPQNWDSYSPAFQRLIIAMKEKKWMNYYPAFEGLVKASQGLASRITFPNKLSEASTVFLSRREEIEKCFHSFMIDAKSYFDAKYLELNL
jgi:acyl carrier protein phosphodiesterase